MSWAFKEYLSLNNNTKRSTFDNTLTIQIRSRVENSLFENNLDDKDKEQFINLKKVLFAKMYKSVL